MLDIAPLCLRFLRRTWREIDASYSVGGLKTRPRSCAAPALPEVTLERATRYLRFSHDCRSSTCRPIALGEDGQVVCAHMAPRTGQWLWELPPVFRELRSLLNANWQQTHRNLPA